MNRDPNCTCSYFTRLADNESDLLRQFKIGCIVHKKDGFD